MTWLLACHHPVPEKTPKQRDDKSAEEEPMSPLGPVTASRSHDSKSKQTRMTWQHKITYLFIYSKMHN